MENIQKYSMLSFEKLKKKKFYYSWKKEKIYIFFGYNIKMWIQKHGRIKINSSYVKKIFKNIAWPIRKTGRIKINFFYSFSNEKKFFADITCSYFKNCKEKIMNYEKKQKLFVLKWIY